MLVLLLACARDAPISVPGDGHPSGEAGLPTCEWQTPGESDAGAAPQSGTYWMEPDGDFYGSCDWDDNPFDGFAGGAQSVTIEGGEIFFAGADLPEPCLLVANTFDCLVAVEEDNLADSGAAAIVTVASYLYGFWTDDGEFHGALGYGLDCEGPDCSAAAEALGSWFNFPCCTAIDYVATLE